jgi:Na+-transporting NADH:ubiquinone oxidoreductase subunit A
MRPSIAVEEGLKIARGQTIFADRRRPEIQITSPVSGVVSLIKRGPSRSLDSVIISVEGDADTKFEVPDISAGSPALRKILLRSGLWPAFRQRPYGRIPDHTATPHAIFVTAMSTEPFSPDPASIIDANNENFRRGLEWVSALNDGIVYLCQDHDLQADLPLAANIEIAIFEGNHPAGTPSLHIHKLAPARPDQVSWHIGYQDVIAIGHLAQTGTISGERVISLGSGMRQDPYLNTSVEGVALADLFGESLTSPGSDAGPLSVFSGSEITGRPAAYLGRYHDQVHIAPRQNNVPARHTFWERFLGRTSQRNPIVPTAMLEQVFPFDIYPVPLMRALASGDVEGCEHLGCLELVEDDVALLSRFCCSGANYGALLRHSLDQLEG